MLEQTSLAVFLEDALDLAIDLVATGVVTEEEYTTGHGSVDNEALVGVGDALEVTADGVVATFVLVLVDLEEHYPSVAQSHDKVDSRKGGSGVLEAPKVDVHFSVEMARERRAASARRLGVACSKQNLAYDFLLLLLLCLA